MLAQDAEAEGDCGPGLIWTGTTCVEASSAGDGSDADYDLCVWEANENWLQEWRPYSDCSGSVTSAALGSIPAGYVAGSARAARNTDRLEFVSDELRGRMLCVDLYDLASTGDWKLTVWPRSPAYILKHGYHALAEYRPEAVSDWFLQCVQLEGVDLSQPLVVELNAL